MSSYGALENSPSILYSRFVADAGIEMRSGHRREFVETGGSISVGRSMADSLFVGVGDSVFVVSDPRENRKLISHISLPDHQGEDPIHHIRVVSPHPDALPASVWVSN